MGTNHERMQWTVSIEPYRTVEGDIYETVIRGGQKSTSETHYKERTFYDSPIGFTIAGLGENGCLYGMDGKATDSMDELNDLIEIIEFMNSSDKSSFNNPLSDISATEVLRELITKIRETPRMRLEYNKREFYRALRKVGSKATKMEDVEESGYERGENVVLATTGWLKVERDGKKFELRFDTVDQMNNGSYSELDEVSRRELGDGGEGQYLFGETQLWRITFNPIKTAEQLQEYIDMLELLDKAIPDPTVVSS